MWYNYDYKPMYYNTSLSSFKKIVFFNIVRCNWPIKIYAVVEERFLIPDCYTFFHSNRMLSLFVSRHLQHWSEGGMGKGKKEKGSEGKGRGRSCNETEQGTNSNGSNRFRSDHSFNRGKGRKETRMAGRSVGRDIGTLSA